MKTKLILLTLLFSVNSMSAEKAPAWWKDSSCSEARNRNWLYLIKEGYSREKATKRTDDIFKSCICSSGDETKLAVDSLLEGHEIEVISADGDSVLSVPIRYGYDFSIMYVNTQCYLHVNKSELCKNSGFMSEARQSFRGFDKYDSGQDLCVTDINNSFFKGE
ncbi:hypothetical protein [Pseudomonas sp. 50_B]|uniref:hypothetical protein n=1 Tax=Pseudomonas sp. 50_B TaxID=2813574 RepID=UPI001A9D9DB9|nr:hypothetical protein [Pseudomonas sp. 50_B]